MYPTKGQVIGILRMICEGRELPPGTLEHIDELTHLRDHLQLDSLDLAELSVRIEDAFQVDIYADGLVNTLGDVLKKLPL
ncbi:MAG: acyl carrier protein [Bacteroidota bacterium]